MENNTFGGWKFSFCSLGQNTTPVSSLQLTLPLELSLHLGGERDSNHFQMCNLLQTSLYVHMHVHFKDKWGHALVTFYTSFLLNSLNRGGLLSV